MLEWPEMRRGVKDGKPWVAVLVQTWPNSKGWEVFDDTKQIALLQQCEIDQLYPAIERLNPTALVQRVKELEGEVERLRSAISDALLTMTAATQI